MRSRFLKKIMNTLDIYDIPNQWKSYLTGNTAVAAIDSEKTDLSDNTAWETPSALGDPTLWKPRFTDDADNGAGIADVPDSLCTRISENLEAKEGLPGCLLRVALS